MIEKAMNTRWNDVVMYKLGFASGTVNNPIRKCLFEKIELATVSGSRAKI